MRVAVEISSDVGTEGYAYFWNMDPTNYIVLSTASDGSTPLVKLFPDQIAVFPLATGTLYAMANTSACRMMVGVAEA